MGSKIAKDDDTLYEFLDEQANLSDFNWRKLPNLAEIVDELGWAENTVRGYIQKLLKDDKIIELSPEDSSRRFIPSYMNQNLFLESGNIQEHINGVVEGLRDRILRNPTIEEVAEEMRVNADDHFEEIFRRNVDDDWRSPHEDTIEEKREEVQKCVEGAIRIYIYGNDDPDHIDTFATGDSLEYYEKNKELMKEFEIRAEKEDGFPGTIHVKSPAKLRRFMTDPEFIIQMSQRHEYDDENVLDINDRIREKLDKHNNA